MNGYPFARFVLVSASIALISGCASLSEEECRTADWQRLGFDDGSAGHSDSRIAEHAEACAKTGIRPNTQQWRAGWDQGVLTYCTPKTGWREGLAGRSYHGVCRGRNEDNFLYAFNYGTEIHRLQARVESNHMEIRRLERQLAEASTNEARQELRRRIRQLDHDQSRLRSSLGQLQANAPRF